MTLDVLVPVDQLPKLCGVSPRTIRRWMERDGVGAVWVRNEATSGRKAVRRGDIPASWGLDVMNTGNRTIINGHFAAREAERNRWRTEG
ncbi:hypothetical protein ACFUTX_06750 [Microbacterium sp. NPDC057407]|uniref:hypothetical protein n=1 Tax=Microbacterium sp. NPDC057407 TaxID=3346120 RepID=UPI00366ADC96